MTARRWLFAGVLLLVGLVASRRAGAQDLPFGGPVTFHATSGGASDSIDAQIDIAPPTVQILSPTPGSVIGSTSVTVTGTVTDFAELDSQVPGNVGPTADWSLLDVSSGIEVSSGSVPIVAGRFAIPDLALVVGQNTVIVRTTDAAGSTNLASTDFTVDPNAPAVALDGDHDGEATLFQELQVSLDFAGPTTLLSVNGAPDGRAFPAGLAQNALALPLQFGPNTFDVALQSGGATSTFSFTFFRVASVDPIAILSPPGSSLVNTTTIPVVVTAPLGTPFVTINGLPAVRGEDLQTFALELPLNEGLNTITALAYPFGQRASVQVVRDTTPPKILALSPGDGLVMLGSSVHFQGIASEPALVDIGSEVDFFETHTLPILAPDQPFFSFVPLYIHTFEIPQFGLAPGDNEIGIVLTDRAGNTSETVVHVTQTDSALNLLDPADGSVTDALTTTLRLQAVEQVRLVAVYVGGSQLSALRSQTLPAGISTFDQIPLQPGPNDIRIVYQRFGDPTQRVLLTTVNSSAVITPVTPITVVQGLIIDSVSGSPLGGATVSITPTGSEDIVLTTGSDGRFRTLIPPGPYSIVVQHEGFLPASGSDVAALGETIEIDHAMLPWTTGVLPATPTESTATADHLDGVVTSEATGQPLPGAQITVTANGGAVTNLVSAADGSFQLDGIPLGPFAVAVSKTGFFPIQYNVDDTTAVNVRLTPALKTKASDVSVVVTVQNPTTGDPSPGVRATLIGTSSQVFSDAQGHFQMDHVPIGQRSLRLEKSGFTDSVVLFDANPRVDGGPTMLTLPYPQNTGQAKFIATSPGQVAYVRDRFSNRGIAGATVAAGAQTLTTDADGAFVIPSLASGQYSFVASASHYGSETLRVVIAPDGAESLAFDLLSQLRGAVVGTIQDATTHVGISFATVKVAGSTDQITQTASDGSFVLPGVTPGTYDLEVTHQEYLAGAIPAVSVASNANTVANSSLTHRPMVGGVTGLVLDADAHTPIANAVISLGTISTTSDAQGRYALSGLPSGMDTLAIIAPGYPATTRDVAIMADADPMTPSIVRTDFHISQQGGPEPDHPVEIDIATGGRVSDPSGRLTLILPPLSINRDARVTVRLSGTPEVASGQPVPVDSSLQAPPLLAVGPEMEILLEPLVPGAPVPQPISPWILLQRYSGVAASAAGIAESSLIPLPWNGSEFTAFETIPYMHVVDQVDRLVAVVVNPGTTESGVPLFASLIGKDLPLYAASIEPQPTPNQFDLSVQLSAVTIPPAPTEPVATALVKDLRTEPALTADPNTAPHPNAFPLLFIHGWDLHSIFTNGIPQSNPFDDPVDKRFSHMIPDIINGTAGIYRPIWVSYNTRAPASATAWNVYVNLQSQLASNIRGIPIDPEDPNSGKFDSINIFGYSKGGLIERSLLCAPGIDGLGAVAMATPHHGAARRLIPLLDTPIPFAQPTGDPDVPMNLDTTPPPTLRQIMAEAAPGTAELFDYPDDESRFTLNPYLSELNERECSVARNRMTLIAGDDPTNHSIKLIIDLHGLNAGLLAAMSQNAVVPPNFPEQVSQLDEANQVSVLAPVFNLGTFLASNPSDSVVPLSSASGRDHSDVPLPAFQGVDKGQLRVTDPTVDPVHFNHFDAGEESQPLGPLVDEFILPTFSDWYNTTQTQVPVDILDPDQPGRRIFTGPTTVDWYSSEELFTGFARVVYARDRNGTWHLVAGADQQSGEIPKAELDLSNRTDAQKRNSLGLAATQKVMQKPITYFLPTQDSKGNPISSWTADRIMVTVPLPYHDPDATDPDSENIMPTEALPKMGFESFVHPGAPPPFQPPSDVPPDDSNPGD